MPWRCSCGFEAGDYDVICSRCGIAKPNFSPAMWVETRRTDVQDLPGSGSQAAQSKPKFFWLVTILGAVVGTLFLVGAFLEDSAPKQAASAAIAVAFAVIPYCLARAVSELSGRQTEAVAELKGLNEKLETHTRLLAALANAAEQVETGTKVE